MESQENIEARLGGTLLDVVGALVVVLDRDGRILLFNKACETATGYTQAEVEGRKVWDFLLLPSEIEPVKRVFLSLHCGASPNQHANAWLTRSGEKRLIAWSNAAVPNDAGELELIIGTGIDVTDHDSATGALLEQQAELNAILESAVDAILTIDDRGVIRQVNPAIRAIFGYEPREIIGLNISVLMPEPDRSAHDRYIQRYMAGGEPRIIGVGREVLGRHKDGTHFPLRLSISELAPLGRRLFTGILHDLTERKRYEAMSGRLDRIVEAAVNEVLVFHAERLTLLQANLAARENLGIAPADMGVLGMRDVYPDFARPAALQGLLAPLRDGTQGSVEIETHQRRKDGKRYQTRVRLQLIESESPAIFFAVAEDITRAKTQEAQLQQALKMEAVGQLTGGMAHDFNNLLTIIVGNLELLEMRLGADQEEARELIADAQGAADLGAELTNRLLAFARKQSLAPSLVDPNDLVLDMSELLRRTLGESISISTLLAHDLSHARVDPGQLQNALLNLAINARDAMPEGGSLTIETADTRLEEDYAALVPDLDPGDYVEISVTDTGIGMSPETAQRSMEPFFTTKEAGAGSGLGLSMVFGFAKQSGGHLQIESEIGHGTTVSIYLPVAEREHASRDAAGTAPPVPKSKGETVLLVEDDPGVRQLSARRLKELGYRVLEAEDGPSALARIERGEAVDLLFTDFVMPGGMTGKDLAREALTRRPDLKVVHTTGFSEAATSHPEDPGAADARFLRKPYRLAELALKLRQALDG